MVVKRDATVGHVESTLVAAAQFLVQLVLPRCITLGHRIRELFATRDQINVATFLLVVTTKLGRPPLPTQLYSKGNLKTEV